MSDADKAKMSAYGRSIINMQERADVVYSFSREKFYQDNEASLADYDAAFRAEVDGNTVSVPLDSFVGGKSVKTYFDGLYTYRKNTLWNSLAK